MIIAVDFDGTLHNGEWPAIGCPAVYSIEMMQRLKGDGHFLIIWTCREGEYRDDMVNWLTKWNIPYDSINEHNWVQLESFPYESRKVYADVYIEDKNLGGLPSWREIYDIVSGKVKPHWIYKFLK
jgi:hypothetical protein